MGRPRIPGSSPVSTWVFALSAVLFGVCVYAPLARGVFFLYDDFAHLQLVQSQPLPSFFRMPMAGMFRPIFFTSLWVEFRWFGWAFPGGYVAVSAVLHIFNAMLFARVLRLYGENERVAWLSATFFLVFPSVNEVHIWAACRGDLLCVTAMLLALALCRGAVRSIAPWKRVLLGGSAALFLMAALMAKEFAVAFPLLFVALALGRAERPAVAGARRVAGAAGASLAVIGLFVMIRSRVMPLGSTHYGSAGELFGGASLLGNSWTYVVSLCTVPFFEEASLVSWAVRATGLIGAMAILLGIRAAGLLAGGALVFAGFAFLAPVVWIAAVPGAAVGGHVLYSATLCFALLQGLGAASLLPDSRKSVPLGRGRLVSACGWGLVAGIVLGAAASGNSLARTFGDAYFLSQSVMRQVEPHLKEPALFIRNTPWGFRNGPHLLPCYAYPAYFSGLGMRVPVFRCDGVILEKGWRATIEWTPRRPDPYSQYSTPREDEDAVELDLQKHIPAGG